jgi:hypothetical protein
MRYIFNKYVVIVVVLVLLASTGIKIHASLNRPSESDWNYKRFRRIDTRRKDFSFAVFGDNKNSISTFNQLITDVNRDKVIFALDDGDLVFEGDMEKFGFFLNQARRFNKPLLTAIGNHETYDEGRGNYYKIFGSFYYSFTVGQSYFIVADDANEHNIDGWQLGWLKNELAKSQAYKYRFVFLHVPLFDPRGNGIVGEHGLQDAAFANELNGVFDRNNVTMLFTSHIHGYYRGVWGKTPYIITGGAGAEIAGSDPAHYFYHYVRVNVSDSSVSYDVVRLSSPGPGLLVRFLHNAWIYIYAWLAMNYIDIVLVLALLYLLLFVLYVLEKRRGWWEKLVGIRSKRQSSDKGGSTK